MNIYLMVDMEGICGIYEADQVSTALKGPRYQEGRERMTRDINVCVEACKEAGAEKVYVQDCHGGGSNILWDRLSPMADYYIMGAHPGVRYPGLEDCDGVMLLGYHAMAGTPGGILEHTMSSATMQNYWLNGQLTGETGIDAGIAGDYGKPVIMVSGDDKVCAEASALMPWVVTAEVKKGLSVNGGMLRPPEAAYALLRAKVKEAIGRIHEMKPLVYGKPIRLRVERVERGSIPSEHAKPYMKIISGRIYEVEGATVEEALFRL